MSGRAVSPCAYTESATVSSTVATTTSTCASTDPSRTMIANTIEASPRGPNQPTNATVGPRARHLLAVDVFARASGDAQLLKLAVEGLAHGADARIADQAFFGMSFGHILRKF